MVGRIDPSQSSDTATKRHGMTLSVLVPSSLVRETDDKRAATRKVGSIARAATVFRVNRVIVFDDPDGDRNARWDGGFVETVLRYAATPPYLRKDVWGSRPELEYAGVLPPLLAVSRTGSGSSDSGSLRQGLVTRVGPEDRVWVNCGLQHPISLVVPPDMAVDDGTRVAVRISSRRPVRAKLVDEPLPGYDVDRMDLTSALELDDAGVRIATSRHGVPITVERIGSLVGDIQQNGAIIAFGAPGRGLPDIIGIDTATLEPADGTAGRFDHWVNVIPHQGSDVVRTEEAMFAALACLTLTE